MKDLVAYDEFHRSRSLVFYPSNDTQLSQLVANAPPGRQLTFRGGGQGFDTQALNDDIVVDMTAFAFVGEPQHDDNGFFVTMGAGVKWSEVIAKLAPLGLFPRSLVTATRATVGGTVASHCVSRMSSMFGKEGVQVRSFRIVLASGKTIKCERDDPDPANRLLFSAAIGGFGYLGVFIEITFDLLPIDVNPGSHRDHWPVVITRATRFGTVPDWDRVLRRLHAKRPKSDWLAISGASFLTGGALSFNLLEQKFGSPRALQPATGGIYAKDPSVAATGAVLSTLWPSLVEMMTDIGFPEGDFVDDLEGWSFFFGRWADAAKTKSCARLNFTQQSFAIPSTASQRPDTRPIRRFIELFEARVRACNVRPAAIDFLHIPADRFLMSASRDLDSYLLTVSLAYRNRWSLDPSADEFLRGLSHDCRRLGGRVHLVKGVVADRSDLHAMYGTAARDFVQLKNELDPLNVFRNKFFERVFEA